MIVHTFERRQKLREPREKVFAFFRTPENLAGMTPPHMGFRILTPSPIVMRTGALIDYTVRVLGMSVRWTTMITTYDPPFKFVDEQLKGPYSFWHHTHAFLEQDDGTLMVDTVRYALPCGALGSLAHTTFVRRQIERIFEYRAQVIARVFETPNVHDPHSPHKS